MFDHAGCLPEHGRISMPTWLYSHPDVAANVVDAHPDVAVNVADVSSHSDGAVNVVGTRTVTRCY